ncbi:metallophosphoesterase, partial [Serratia sp. C2(2)]|nr:metallophosphoesterase [Serratia sp. C2(2)]
MEKSCKFMKILIISDLHVGTTARAKDFCTLNGNASSAITENFIDDFRELVENEKINATHLLIAGDITNSGETLEFEIAAERIKEIITILDIDVKNVFFVPGNHDGNWDHERESTSRGDGIEKSRAAKYTNIKNNDFFSSV